MALQGDGNGIVTIPGAVATGDFSVIFDAITLSAGTEIIIGDNSANNQFIAVFSGSDIGARINGFNVSPNYNGSLDEVVKLEVKRVGNTVSTVVNDSPVGTVAVDAGTQFTLSTFFAYNAGSLKGNMLLGGLVTMVGFGNTRTYDTSGSGTTLIDTTDGQNGTLSGFTTGGFTVQSGSVSINSVVDHQSRQRDVNGQAVFTIAGDLVGVTATSIEYQLDSGVWSVLDASPTTTYSGSVTITNEQTVSVRVSNDVAVTASVQKLKAAMCIVIGPAQSNAVSRLSNLQTLTIGAGNPTPAMHQESGFSALEDPTSFRNSTGTGGSLWVYIAQQYSDAGIPVCFGNTAQGGTTIANWSAGNSLHDRILDFATQCGGIEKIITLLGESDSSAGTSKAAFKSSYITILEGLNTTYGSDVYAVYFPVASGTGTPTNVQNIRTAYDELINENAFIKFGGDLSVIDISSATDPLNDDLHIKLDADGEEASEIIYYALQGLPTTLDITMTGIPDGTYLTRVFDESTNVLIFNEPLAFTGGASQIDAFIAVGTQTTSFVIDSSVSPSQFGADNGVTV